MKLRELADGKYVLAIAKWQKDEIFTEMLTVEVGRHQLNDKEAAFIPPLTGVSSVLVAGSRAFLRVFAS